jgi:hypothetical protein
MDATNLASTMVRSCRWEARPMAKDDSRRYSPSRFRGLRPQWKPGQSGNPKGRPQDVDRAREQIRDFMLCGGGMEQWVALTRHRNPMVRVYVFRDLMRYGFGLPPQEIRVERHASTVNLHLAAVADPSKYTALEEARARVQSLLLDIRATKAQQPVGEKGDRDGQRRDADGSATETSDSRGDET